MPPPPPKTPDLHRAADPGGAPAIPWHWRHPRGWPEGLPFDARLANRAAFDIKRESVKKELDERFARSGGHVGRMLGWHTWLVILVANVPWLLARGLEPFTSDLARAAIVVPAVLLLIPLTWTITVRRVHRPRWRAMLRREHIDCCVRCGQLFAFGDDAERCPECGMDHHAFPLDWGPGPIGSSSPPSLAGPEGPTP